MIDAAFQRPDRESRLVRILSQQLPRFDAGLSLVATQEERDIAYSLFVPRSFFLRGCEVPLVISSPCATLPEARGQGAGRFLLDIGLAALADRGLRGAVALGGRSFFEPHGYRAAFNLYTLDGTRVATEPFAAHASAEWVGLSADDIPSMQAMYAANYRHTCGSEVRSGAPIDWESSSVEGYTLVHRDAGNAICYLRFRVRDKLEVMECAAADQRAVEIICGFIHRLTIEHNRASADVHLPPEHPVYRTLFNAGCMAESNNFHDEARLLITDWKGFFDDTASFFAGALRRSEVKSVSLGLQTRSGPESWQLTRDKNSITVKPGQAQIHIEIPEGWAEPLMTGRLNWHDMVFRAGQTNQRLMAQLFPGGTPMWTYSPAFDIAYE